MDSKSRIPVLSEPLPVQIEVIEAQKENIEPLHSGRSASALARAFVIPLSEQRDEIIAERDTHEKAIQEADELDDPLEVYLDYIKWATERFPTGAGATVEPINEDGLSNANASGLVGLLERTTAAFRDFANYKDDPRYLRVWLRYIKYSDSPREVFIYLYRKEIGRGLARFYEEYAAYMESIGYKRQATEIYESGLVSKARPLARLKRKYQEFRERIAQDTPNPNEPAGDPLPIVRQALAVRSGDEISGLFSANATRDTRTARDIFGAPESPKRRLEVFADPDNKHSGSLESKSGGWDTLGTLASRKKENTIQAETWVGQKLEAGGNKGKGIKMPVFRDTEFLPKPSLFNGSRESNNPLFTSNISSRLVPYFKQPEPVAGKRREHIAVALEFLHDKDGNECCLEEILASVRGYKSLEKSQNQKRWPRIDKVTKEPWKEVLRRQEEEPQNIDTQQPNKRQRQSLSLSRKQERPTTPEKSSTVPNAFQDTPVDVPQRRMLHTTSIPLREEGQTATTVEPARANISISQESPTRKPASPTMTMMTKAATEEVYEMFNQPLKSDRHSDSEDEEENDVFNDDDDYSITNTNTNTRSQNVSALDSQNTNTDSNFEKSIDSKLGKTKDSKNKLNKVANALIEDRICDPSSNHHRMMILQQFKTLLSRDVNFYYLPNVKFSKEQVLRHVFGSGSSNDRGLSITYPFKYSLTNGKNDLNKKGIEIKIQRLLGEGGFGRVYLTSSGIKGTADLALKVEKSKIPWEYYILKKIHNFFDEKIKHLQSLKTNKAQLRASNLERKARDVELAKYVVIKPYSLYLFQNETHLFLDYAGRVTLLDSLNCLNMLRTYRSSGVMPKTSQQKGCISVKPNIYFEGTLENLGGDQQGGLGEVLTLGIAIQLIKSVEKIHEAGVLHCDIKPDNIMIILNKPGVDFLDPFEGLSIKLIDFGRAVDANAYSQNTQFLSTWKADACDFWGIQKQKSWKYGPDYHGIASVIYASLFGKYISVSVRKRSKKSMQGYSQENRDCAVSKEEIIQITTPFKRSWNQKLWTRVFETLLNPWLFVDEFGTNSADGPISNYLKILVADLEEALQSTQSFGKYMVFNQLKCGVEDLKQVINV